MIEQMLSKYAFREFTDSEKDAFAVADKNFKLISFSRGFKKASGFKRIKNISFVKLFNLNGGKFESFDKEKEIPVDVLKQKKQLVISPLSNGKKKIGYLLRLNENNTGRKNKALKNKADSTSFSKELQQILTLLLKENSLYNLASEILMRYVSLTKSSFAVVVLYLENSKNEFLFFDPDKKVSNTGDAKKSINNNLLFINEWIKVNKGSLLIRDSANNIGYNLLRDLESKSIIVSPCMFDEKLLATLIVAKTIDSHTAEDIINAEQFAALLSFAVSSIRTRELNAALENRLLQAQKLETIGKLSSGMAHDFSNLLSSIFGSVNLLKKRIPQNEDLTRLLDNIENCAIRATDLTKGLLSFGKPTPKRKELIKTNNLLSEISKVVTQTFPRRIAFERDIEENLSNILGNSTEIYQVLLNLCINAKEAIEGKGKITLSAKNFTIDKSNIFMHPLLNEDKYIWFSLKDTGSGIEEENLRKIFDPYFSTKGKTDGSGSGLGLYVTYGIIKAHNGHVEVSSTLGSGTTFDVFIPAFENTKTPKPAAAEKIILLADDEVTLRDLLAELLESYNYNIIKVQSGVEALKILTEEIKVDLAIIDYNMPELDGLQCIKKIRELNFNLPIILSSGSIIFGEDFDYIKQGINSIVNKPYEFDTMLATIQKLI